MTSQDDRDRKLTEALRAVATEDATTGTSAGVYARLAAEVRAIARARRQRTMTFLAAAAVVVIAAGVSVWRVWPTDRGQGTTASTPVAATTIAEKTEVTTEFFPLISGAAPMTATHLVRIEVPRSALASFGLAAGDLARSSSAPVLADLLVGDDGLARAVRFVRPATAEEQKQ